MKLNKRILISAILVLVLAAGGAAAWYFLRDSDEVKIRRTLRDLCSLATKGSGEKTASGGAVSHILYCDIPSMML